MTAVIIIGCGGHGRVVADALLCAGHQIVGFTDADPSRHGTFVDGIAVLGGDGVLAQYRSDEYQLALGIGSVVVSDMRRRIAESLLRQGWKFVTVVHPSAAVSRSARVQPGVHVMAGAIVQPGVALSEGVIVNTGAQIDHDCVVGPYTHIAPGAVLSGNVRIGEDCHIGAGAVIRQDISIGTRVLVAAGAVVVRDAGDGHVLKGVPARSAS